MPTIYDLPEPNNESITRATALSKLIIQHIENHNGQIPFAEFMQMALYHPEYGYYTTNHFTIGAGGDFTTAPEISPLFAQCFAKQSQQILAHCHANQILEIGAGTGRFAKDFLLAMTELGNTQIQYAIHEISPALRDQQQKLLADYPDLIARISWIESLPKDFKGVVIANEVLDALPVHTFSNTSSGMQERCVGWDGKQFIWKLNAATSPLVRAEFENIQTRYQLSNDYQSEINLAMVNFIQTIAASLTSGVILLADYGYGQPEYYHPERDRGTLTCFYQHHRHANPLIFPGLQDITTHVDFTRAAEIGVDAQCALSGFTTQAAFLLACGLMEFAAACETAAAPSEAFALHQAIKYLTMPTEMGERIKIMALSKQIDIPLLGFGLQDRRRDL